MILFNLYSVHAVLNLVNFQQQSGLQARSQDFVCVCGGGGGGGGDNERFERYTMLVPKTHCVDCPTYGLLNSNYSERSFMIRETLTSAQGARR